MFKHILFIFTFSLFFANNNIYFPIDLNQLEYKFIEYNLVKYNNISNIFVLNQPYKHSSIYDLISSEEDISQFKSRYTIPNLSIHNELSFNLLPGISSIDFEDIYPFRINGVTCIDSADEYARVNNTFSSIDHFFVGHERY